jgi:altronate dehydratase large subunit
VAQRIALNVPGAIPFTHPVGCSQVGEDLEITAKTLIGIGRNPNFAGVVVVGLGCERFTPKELADGISDTGKMLESVVIQDEGDSIKAIDTGTRYARAMLQQASLERRQEMAVSELMIGTNCGGSDTTSGLIANPALGMAMDRIVALGGSAILSELTELLGTEHILARRAVNEQVAQDILQAIAAMEARLRQQTQNSTNAKRKNLISTGNFDGGLSSVVEKSLGGMKKSGTVAQFVEVFKSSDAPTRKGLLLMDSPGHDGEVTTGQAAAGAQIVCFPTGRGTPTGFPGVPVIKITGNPKTYAKMRENIDINGGRVITGGCSLQELGEEIYQEILAVASGKITKAEAMGHDEQFCITRMP